MFAIVVAVVSLLVGVASYLMASNQSQQKIEADEFKATTAEEGESIPMAFGTVWLGQNVVYYGEVSTQAVKSGGGKK